MSRKGWVIFIRTLLTIGEVANLLHLSTSQIRFYEKKGLLTPHHKDTNGYRLYSYTEIDRLEYITTFRSIGVPVSEIKEYLEQTDNDNLIEVLDSTTRQLKREVDKLTSQINKLKELKNQFSRNLSLSSQVIYQPKRLLYVIEEDMSQEKHEKSFYDFLCKYHIDYRYHEQQLLTVLIGQTQKLCLFTSEKNESLRQLETYTLEEGRYFNTNTEITDYSGLNAIYTLVSEQCRQAGYTPVDPAVTIEDLTNLLLSKSAIRLTAQIRIQE